MATPVEDIEIVTEITYWQQAEHNFDAALYVRNEVLKKIREDKFYWHYRILTSKTGETVQCSDTRRIITRISRVKKSDAEIERERIEFLIDNLQTS